MQVAIGFGFPSHWLINWREIFKPITTRINCNRIITFDSHLETALFFKLHPLPPRSDQYVNSLHNFYEMSVSQTGIENEDYHQLKRILMTTQQRTLWY